MQATRSSDVLDSVAAMVNSIMPAAVGAMNGIRATRVVFLAAFRTALPEVAPITV